MRRPLNGAWSGWHGLVACYLPLPQISGATRIYDLCAGRHGTLSTVSDTTWTRPNNRPLVALGGGSYVVIPDLRNYFSDQLTVCVSVTVTTSTNFGQIVSAARSNSAPNGEGGFELRLNGSTGRPQFLVDAGGNRLSATSANSIIGVSSQFLSGRYDGANITVLADGQDPVSVSDTGNIEFGSAGGDWRIGVRGNTASLPLSGFFEFVLIFNTAKTDSEVSSLRSESREGWPNAFNRRRTSYISLAASPPATGRVRIYGGIGKQLVGGAL